MKPIHVKSDPNSDGPARTIFKVGAWKEYRAEWRRVYLAYPVWVFADSTLRMQETRMSLMEARRLRDALTVVIETAEVRQAALSAAAGR
jgi:hypothetical protein